MNLPSSIQTNIQQFQKRLTKEKPIDSVHLAIDISKLLSQLCESDWKSPKELIDSIIQVAKELKHHHPREFIILNIVMKLLHLIREEYQNTFMNDSNISHSMLDFFSEESSTSELTKTSSEFREIVIQGVDEIIEELETVYNNISTQALDQIHSNEIILTLGYSKTVEAFLLAASRKRTFQVVVVESSPHYHGHDFALSLSKAGVETTVISDAAVFAIMSRVNKVILGTHAVLANGGLIAESGTEIIATAAKSHSTPVVICTGLYKLTPVYPTNDDSFNVLLNPSLILDYSQASLVESVDVVVPKYDYVSPELVDIFITNVGGHPPSYLYRLLKENYHPTDIAEFWHQ